MFITLGKPTLFSLFIFILGIALVLRSSLLEFAIKGQLNTAILTLLMMIGEMIGGSVLFIYKKHIETTKIVPITKEVLTSTEKEVKRVNVAVLHVPDYKKNMFLTYIIIFGLSWIDALSMYSQYAFVITDNASFYNFQFKEFLQVFNMISSYLILHIKLFRHHYTGIILVIIGFFLANINHVLAMNSNNFDDLTFWMQILLAIGYSLLEVYQKKVMDNKFIEPYKLLFFLGSFGICVLGLICSIANIIYALNPNSIFISNIKHDFDHFGLLFSNAEIVFSGIGYLLLCIVANIGFVLVNYFYSPISRIMTDINSFFFIWIIAVINIPFNSIFIIIALIGLIIQLIGMLFYHEMIIVHVLGCDTFTRIGITDRGKRELERTVFELDIENGAGLIDSKDLIIQESL